MSQVKKILVITHQNRIKDFFKRDFGIDEDNFHRLKNGAIIKLAISKHSAKATMHHYGEIGDLNIKKKKKYLKKLHTYFSDITEKHPYGFRWNDIDTKQETSKTPVWLQYIDDDIEVYIVRHGEGTHNVSEKTLDPVLTDSGKEQAKRSGDTVRHIQFDTVFCSNLHRTRETFTYMGLPNKEMVVLPCIHELSIGTDGSKRQALSSFFSKENKAVCGDKEIKNCAKDCCEIAGIKVDWRVYSQFYAEKLQCRDFTFMVIIMLYLLEKIGTQ